MDSTYCWICCRSWTETGALAYNTVDGNGRNTIDWTFDGNNSCAMTAIGCNGNKSWNWILPPSEYNWHAGWVSTAWQPGPVGSWWPVCLHQKTISTGHHARGKYHNMVKMRHLSTLTAKVCSLDVSGKKCRIAPNVPDREKSRRRCLRVLFTHKSFDWNRSGIRLLPVRAHVCIVVNLRKGLVDLCRLITFWVESWAHASVC